MKRVKLSKKSTLRRHNLRPRSQSREDHWSGLSWAEKEQIWAEQKARDNRDPGSVDLMSDGTGLWLA